MNKRIKNAAGILLMIAAIVIVCLAFNVAPRDPIQAILGRWPLLIIAFALAFAGVAIVDARTGRQEWPTALFIGPEKGDNLDRLGSLHGISRRVRKTVNLPRGGQLKLMENDDRFRRRIIREINCATHREGAFRTGHGERGGR